MKRMGMRWVLIATATCWFSMSTQFCSATTLSGLVEFSTDASGNFFNGSVWNTRGGDTAVDLWVVRGGDLHGAFLNGPSDADCGISIPLRLGENTFTILASTGGFTPNHGLNLF